MKSVYLLSTFSMCNQHSFAWTECHARILICYYVRLRAKCVVFSSLLCIHNLAAAIHVVNFILYILFVVVTDRKLLDMVIMMHHIFFDPKTWSPWKKSIFLSLCQTITLSHAASRCAYRGKLRTISNLALGIEGMYYKKENVVITKELFPTYSSSLR